MTDRDDASIPTLTIRATTQHEPPVLTDVAHPQDSDSEYGHARDAQAADQSPPWDVAPSQRTWNTPATPPDTIRPGATPGAASPFHGDSTLRTHPGAPVTSASANNDTTPSDAVLRAALQADIEDAVQDALDEALHQVKARLEAELPDIVARAVRRTRLG